MAPLKETPFSQSTGKRIQNKVVKTLSRVLFKSFWQHMKYAYISRSAARTLYAEKCLIKLPLCPLCMRYRPDQPAQHNLVLSWQTHQTCHTTGLRFYTDRQYMYNVTEARSCNHCCSGKAVSIAYPECMFVALGNRHAMRMRHIVICSLPGSTTFFHIIS